MADGRSVARRPTLSVCCLTGEPGPRVVACLGMLRQVADEIVVAADSRVDGQRLGEYATVADRVYRIEVDHSERHLGWLHAQCSGDWILRVDGDELVAPELVERLPELLADRRVFQYLLPRRWLYPDAEHWLAELPWWPDYQVRLVRNDGLLRFSGAQHTSALPVRPARYLEIPLYHLDLLVKSTQERRDKAALYATRHAPLEAPGGGEISQTFYLPEDRADTTTRPVPAADAAAIAAVLEASPVEAAGVSADRVVTLAESDRYLPGRSVEESAYAASAEAIEGPLLMQPGERRAVHVRFVNEGTDTWPWDPDLGPPIRATYRLRNSRGTIVVGDGPRTAFPFAVAPGESCIVPLDTVAPVVPGRYRLEPDVVHEGVRWFGSRASLDLEVECPPGWEGLLPRHAGRIRLWPLSRKRRGRIPRVVHRVWVGDVDLPAEARRFEETWRRHHPDWEMRLWRDTDIRSLVPEEALARCRSASEASNLARFAILASIGGVYIDTDVECLRSLDPLLKGVQAFAGWETEHRLGTAVLGGGPGHPLFEELAAFAQVTAGRSINNVESTGPGLLTLMAADRPNVTRFERELFYPYRWDERHRRDESFPDSYAVHHWSLSWAPGT